MRYFIILTLVVACGIKPWSKPFNCNGDWVCVCDANLDCSWELRCE